MTLLTAPALPGGFKDPPDGPIVYCFEPLWGAGTPQYFPRYAYEWETKQNERPHIAGLPGQPGGWDVDGDQWHFWEPMTISVRFRSTSNSERRAILAGCVGPGRLWLIDPSSTYYWTRARLVTPRNAMDIYDMAHGLYPLTLDFICPHGSWFGQQDISGEHYGESLYGEGLYGEGAGTITLADADVTGEIINGGNLPAVALKITITASTGGIDTPTIENEETGQTITLNGALADGRAWVLDTSVPSLLKDGADDWDNLSVGAGQQGLLWLLPGSNTIHITAGAAMDGTVDFQFWPPVRH